MARLRGDILQVPAAVSAIKINGVRSYRRVRAGQTVELSERPVTIRRFDLLGRRELEVDGVGCVDLSVVVECSSGTYIRALARDLGAALGVGGHLSSLRRTRVGAFTLDEAQTLEEAERGLRIVPLDRVVPQQLPNFDGQRDPGRPDPERSALGWRELARRHDSITRRGRSLPGALPPGRTGRYCRGCVCLS